MKLLSFSYLILFQIKLWKSNSLDYRIASGHSSLTGTTHGKEKAGSVLKYTKKVRNITT